MILQVDLSLNAIGVIIFIASILVLIGIIAFLENIGNKIQLIPKKIKIWILILSVIPGLILLLIPFLNAFINITLFGLNVDLETYTENTWGNFLQYSLLTSFLFLLGLRLYFSKKIDISSLYKLDQEKADKPILEATDLKIYYPMYGGILKRTIGYVKAVNGVSFKLYAGKTLGLVGESGCGKSTIANHLLGLIKRIDGNIKFENKNLEDPIPHLIRKHIQIVFQDPDASLNPRMKVIDIISEPIKNLLGITKKDEIMKKVIELIEMVSLKREHLFRYPHEFSGGQKQRIIIARALACDPRLIILDEPTSALDVSVQAQILNLLKKLQQNYGYTYLFITHDLSVVHHIADQIAVMYLGKFVEFGPVDEVFKDPKHPYTQALLSARSQIDPERKIQSIELEGEIPSPVNPPSGCYFHPRCPEVMVEICPKKYPGKTILNDKHHVHCYLYQKEKIVLNNETLDETLDD